MILPVKYIKITEKGYVATSFLKSVTNYFIEYHREDGPSFITLNACEWYLDGISFSWAVKSSVNNKNR